MAMQRGAEMSSRLMPPKVERQVDACLDDLGRVLRVQADGKGVYPGELLE